MHLFPPALLSIALLLTIRIDPAASAKMISPLKPRFSTITTTRTISWGSPRMTRTVTATVTTYGPPISFSFQPHTKTTSITLHPTTTPFYINPSTGQPIHSTHVSGKLIGFLFAGGIVLAIFACIAMVVGRKRYRKQQEKRIRDWVDTSSGHGRYSGASKDGTGMLAGDGMDRGGSGGVVEMGDAEDRKGAGMGKGDGEGDGEGGVPPAYQMQTPLPAVLRAL